MLSPKLGTRGNNSIIYLSIDFVDNLLSIDLRSDVSRLHFVLGSISKIVGKKNVRAIMMLDLKNVFFYWFGELL